jgi:hypothetical protein
MKSWLTWVALPLLTAGCDVGGGKLTGMGGGTLATGAGGGGIATGSGGGIATGSGGDGVVGGGTGSGGFPNNPCGTRYPAAPLPAEIMIVLDTSTSMNDGFDGPCAGGCSDSKWGAASYIIQSVASAESPNVDWGLLLQTAISTDACATAGVSVPVGPVSATSIRSEVSRRGSGGTLQSPGNTPTRAAIQDATAHLLARTTAGNHAILLITDGTPDCAPGASDPLASDLTGTLRAIGDARSAGFPTFVAGMAIAPESQGDLSDMALTGGLPRAGSPAYFPVSRRGDLGAAVSELIKQVGTCIFAIPPPPGSDGTVSGSNIGVMVDGTGIPRDTTHTNGWDYLDASQTTFQLFGGACEAALDERPVSVVFHCLIP